MKLKDIILEAEKIAPPNLAEEWDNVGLMVGGADREIKTAVVALDVTEEAVDFAVENKCDLIVSHHPFIMPKMGSLDFGTKKGELIEKLIKNDISVYSMHTNFDTAENGVNDALCEILKLKNKEICGMIRKGELENSVTLKEFIDTVKKLFNVNHVIYSGDLDKTVKKAAVCGGGGGSFIGEVLDCDVFLTGEAKYHEFQTACENGLSVIAAGHFETENITLYKIREFLTDLGIKVKDGTFHHGFSKII